LYGILNLYFRGYEFGAVFGSRIRRIADRIRKPANVFGTLRTVYGSRRTYEFGAVFGGLPTVYGSRRTYSEHCGPYTEADERIRKTADRIWKPADVFGIPERRKLNYVKPLMDGILTMWCERMQKSRRERKDVMDKATDLRNDSS
jgi:hypothetical protein